MRRIKTKTATDIDIRLNQFLAGLFNTPTTIQDVKKHKIPLPELTIEVTTPIRHYTDSVH